MSDAYDQQALNAMVDYWVSPLAVKKDFELSRGSAYSFNQFITDIVWSLVVFKVTPKICSTMQESKMSDC